MIKWIIAWAIVSIVVSIIVGKYIAYGTGSDLENK